MKEKLLQILEEDIGQGDVTTALVPEQDCRAAVTLKEDCLLAGLEEAAFLFQERKVKIVHSAKDGAPCKAGTKVLALAGKNKDILEVERTALNVLSRMSGVATQCHAALTVLKGSRTRPALTRKTSPGFNEFDKKAGELGGAWPHRKNLNDMVLLKENHLIYFNSPKEAAEKARQEHGAGMKVDVEVESLAQALEAAEAKPDIIMLDNFSSNEAKRAVKELRKSFKGWIELSGGINLSNLKAFKAAGADIVSMGCLTGNAKGIDFSLLIEGESHG